MNIKLTQPNAAALEHYADLAGVSPETFLNAFLAKFLLSRFADPRTGYAEVWMGSFKFEERVTAERVAQWIGGWVTVPGSRDTPRSKCVRAATRHAVVQAPIGHDSEAIHQHYVSVGKDALRKAANALPDLT